MTEIPAWIKRPAHDWEVSETALSDAISKFYDRPYQIQQQDPMMGQNQFYFYNVHGSEDPKIWDVAMCEKEISGWLAIDPASFSWEGDFYRECYIDAELALWDMCRKKVIPPGKYMMLVSW